MDCVRHQITVAESSDVPEEAPEFSIDLDEVGICNKTVWALLAQGRMPFEADVTVGLDDSYRGIHMSRIEECIADLYTYQVRDIREYASILSESVLEKQAARHVKVKLKGALPWLTETSVSKKTSLDTVSVSVEVVAFRPEDRMTKQITIGLGLNHITACPCTQKYNQFFYQQPCEGLPAATHSQRCNTVLYVRDDQEKIGFEDLKACLLSGQHWVQDLLKRPDEAEIVTQAHRNPQFIEDVIRNVACQVSRLLGAKLDDSSQIVIESLSQESIHSHDVRARLKASLGQIKKSLKNKANQ